MCSEVGVSAARSTVKTKTSINGHSPLGKDVLEQTRVSRAQIRDVGIDSFCLILGHDKVVGKSATRKVDSNFWVDALCTAYGRDERASETRSSKVRGLCYEMNVPSRERRLEPNRVRSIIGCTIATSNTVSSNESAEGSVRKRYHPPRVTARKEDCRTARSEFGKQFTHAAGVIERHSLLIFSIRCSDSLWDGVLRKDEV